MFHKASTTVVDMFREPWKDIPKRVHPQGETNICLLLELKENFTFFICGIRQWKIFNFRFSQLELNVFHSLSDGKFECMRRSICFSFHNVLFIHKFHNWIPWNAFGRTKETIFAYKIENNFQIALSSRCSFVDKTTKGLFALSRKNSQFKFTFVFTQKPASVKRKCNSEWWMISFEKLFPTFYFYVLGHTPHHHWNTQMEFIQKTQPSRKINKNISMLRNNNSCKHIIE